MSERTVKVSLTAQVAGYVNGMEQARKKSKELGESSEQLKARLAEQHKAMNDVGTGMMKVGALATVATALAVSRWADFDQAMSSVKASTQETAANMEQLQDAALDAGGSTVFTAMEAANAIEEMGKAGVSTADILGGGLDGALDLAASGQLDVARAAEIAAISMKQFGLAGGDIPHIADLLAAGAGKAAGGVEDLVQALNQSALVANQTGLSIEETTGTLSAFAAAGLLGSDAGTSFKSMLQRLTPQSAEAQKLMDKLGISAYDATGAFVGMEAFAGNLQTSLKDLTVEQRNSAMATIFGSDAVRASSVLYEQGSEGIAEWNNQVNDSGYAAKVAADRLDNLKGDVEALGGAFDTALIKSGSTANDVLRTMVQSATFLVDGIGDLPEPVLGAGLAVGSLTAAVGLAGGAALFAVPKVAEFKASLSTLGVSGGKAALGIGIAAGSVAAASIALSVFIAEQAKAKAAVERLSTTLDQQTSAITRGTREMVKENLAAKQSWWFIEGDSTFDAAEKLGISLDLVTDAATGNVDAIKKLEKELDIGTVGSDKLADSMARTGMTSTDLASAIGYVTVGVAGESKSLAEAIRVTEQKNSVTGEGTDITHAAADAYLEAADEAAGLNSKVLDLIETINEANGVGQDAVSANAAYQSSIEGVDEHIRKAKEGVEGYSLGLDESTAAGSANMKMLSDMAGDYQDAAKAQFDLDGNTETYTANLKAGQKAVLDRAKALGATDDEILFLTEHIAAMPSEAEVKVIADTSEAQRRLDAIKTTMQSFQSSNATITAYVREVGGRAEGGAIAGPGGPRDDKAGMFALSNGEHVWTAAEVVAAGGQDEMYRMRHAVLSGRGYADGGAVGYAPQYATPQYASSGGSGAAVAQMPDIYVQNPFTGEYLLARVDGRIDEADRGNTITDIMGKQVR